MLIQNSEVEISAQSISVEFCPFSTTLVSVIVFWYFLANFFFWIRNFRTCGTVLTFPAFVICAAIRIGVMSDIFVFQASFAFFFFVCSRFLFLRALFFLCSASSSRAAFLSFSLFRNFKILGGRFKSFAEDLDSPIMFVCCGRFLTRCKGGRGISLDFFFGGEMFRAWKFLVGRR